VDVVCILNCMRIHAYTMPREDTWTQPQSTTGALSASRMGDKDAVQLAGRHVGDGP
jgi:hypothetical protein